MKKFHKRAAVFLTAATLAGLPAGAFFYSSPGSLTVWADNVEVESSEESSPEDVDFSDESEAEILADPVEQAQEDAGNDVTETPEVGITFTEPEGWQTDTATVKIQVEDTKNTGACPELFLLTCRKQNFLPAPVRYLLLYPFHFLCFLVLLVQ